MVTRVRSHYKIVARNFIYEEAQRRMSEIVGAAQQISTNSVFVHATPILYFAQANTGTKCSCREKVMQINKIPVSTPGTPNSNIELDLTTPLFGGFQSAGSVASELQDDDLIDSSDESPNSGKMTINALFGNSTECPICFRIGSIPGFQPLGYNRQVFSTVNCYDSYGYFVDSSNSVSNYVIDDKVEGYVEFTLQVPLIFHAMAYAVLDMKNIVRTANITSFGEPLTTAVIDSYRGKSLAIRISGESFTHCIFQFKISNKQYLADFPQDQRPKDYAIFDSTQPVQIVMDKSVPTITNGDIIYKSEYKTFWKVTDFDYLRMHYKTVIGWNLSARLVQADEVYQKLMNFC